MKLIYRLLAWIEHPPLDHLSPDAQAVLGSIIYLVGGGLFFLVAGLIVSVVPFWLLDLAVAFPVAWIVLLIFDLL